MTALCPGSGHAPGGVIPVVVPTDLILVRRPGLVAWVGAITVFPQGFLFTLQIQFDTSPAASPPPQGLALFLSQRETMTWLEVAFADGRRRAADLNTNTPIDAAIGPRLLFEDGASSASEGWDHSRWWVTPLPPSGPVHLAIHLDGQPDATGTAILDGRRLIDAAAQAETYWTKTCTCN